MRNVINAIRCYGWSFEIVSVEVSRSVVLPGEPIEFNGIIRNDGFRIGTAYVQILAANAYRHQVCIIDSNRDLDETTRSTLRLVDVPVDGERHFACTLMTAKDCPPGPFDIKAKVWSPPKRFREPRGFVFAGTRWKGGFEVVAPASSWQRVPTAFISYSWDSDQHKAWVVGLADEFLKHGVNVVIDVRDLYPGEDIIHFIERAITSCDFVILVCSTEYTKKANERRAGVGIETVIGAAEYFRTPDKRKFVPITRDNNDASSQKCPTYLGMAKYVDFDTGNWTAAPMNEVIRSMRARMAKMLTN